MKRWSSVVAVSSLTLTAALLSPPASAQVDTQLVGNALVRFPSFEYVRAHNTNAAVQLAIAPSRFPAIVGQTCDIYVVTDKTAAQWAGDPSLVDVRGAPQTKTFAGGSISATLTTIATPGQLASGAGTTNLGQGYDVVLDCNRNAVVDAADYMDGRNPDEGGFYVVQDTTTAGPLTPICATYAVAVGSVTAGFESERTCYPSDIASRGKVPVVIISHGNGHVFSWYDYLEMHLASYGYVVMSHANNTGPGIESCSLTTLQHTDAFLGQQGAILGGVLNGHLDETQIVWIGHSRGGEGVARAFDRITDLPPSYTPVNFTSGAIKLISSIAPTDFLGPNSSNPHAANYHLLYGAADGDVSGAPNNDIADSFNVYERATGFRQAHYLHGVGHNEFNCCGFADATGPALIGRPATQTITKGYYLPLIKRYLEGSLPAKDFLWRQYERFKPIGALASCGFPDLATCATLDLEYKDGPAAGNFMIDDYETQFALTTSSSGGAVTTDTFNRFEGLMNDIDGVFAFAATDPMSGMTRARTSDTTRGTVFTAAANSAPYMEWEVIAGQRDFSTKAYLSFRACQQTRHPETTLAPLGDQFFLVFLRDASGKVAPPIRIDAYGGGIEEPYQRTGFGAGAGWQNEFETIRIRLTDFLNAGTLDLTNVTGVRIQFGDNSINIRARMAMDDLEVTAQE